MVTPIHLILTGTNSIYIKREDFIPFSFGGNKARKAIYFFDEIDSLGCDCVVTYGSSSSNHCRVVSNMAAARGLDCYIISPQEQSETTFNTKLMVLFGANIQTVPVEKVHDTIESKLEQLKSQGRKPYFIAGGGHGNLGTQAYVDCYKEITDFEKSQSISFDYIFFASGTGTTHAGLVCGKLLSGGSKNIIGISIARKNPRGRDVVVKSIEDYFSSIGAHFTCNDISDATVFIDDYTDIGYGKSNDDIEKTIKRMIVEHGIPLDETYTGKAYYGMCEYIRKNNLNNKNILFIHTGGTPLFFSAIDNLTYRNSDRLSQIKKTE